MNEQPHRPIRSFVMRTGRMTSGQARALEELWPRFGVEYSPQPLALDALFGRHAPRTLEIGFGNGEHLASLASAHPERDYLGVEVHRPGVGHLLMLAATHNLTNIRASSHDAVEVLREQIAPGALDEVLVLFPDPWHKKRHHKRRLIQPAFVELVASRLASGGVWRLATDWEPYAQQMLEVLSGAHALFENLSPTDDWMPRPEERAPTRFEKRGARLGHGVWDLAFRRR
ncbi:MAG TPA: tRNA (guanosine(46)-N7)-methyltransferase TrmB [Steroidobacteraceae bacterium]|jgi:tRNA (guanine-N7-)-methyltransferase|nr:tRNA (guanosine(46)-N7)-methyltransferase TrmB [Steroidobacteraceae bacterium]